MHLFSTWLFAAIIGAMTFAHVAYGPQHLLAPPLMAEHVHDSSSPEVRNVAMRFRDEVGFTSGGYSR
jgi:hypothetical protein